MTERKIAVLLLSIAGFLAIGCETLVESSKPKHRVPYLPSQETLAACSLDLLWHAEVDANDISRVYLLRDVICLESASLRLYVIETATGLIRWQLTLLAPLEHPPCDNLKQLFLVDGQQIRAFEKMTGTPQWSITPRDLPLAGPAASEEIVYCPVVRGGLRGYSATDGKRIFEYFTRGRVVSPALADGATVYAGDEAGWIYAIAFIKEQFPFEKKERLREELLWEKQTRGGIEATPGCNDKAVFVGSKDYKVYALDKLTGAPLWQASTGSMVLAPPICADGMVFVQSFKNGLYVFGAEKGDLICQLPDGTALVSVVGNQNFYVLNTAGKIVALDKKNRQPLWKLTPSHYQFVLSNCWTSPIFLASKDGRVVALAEKGAKMLAYQPPTPAPIAPKKSVGKVPAKKAKETEAKKEE